MAGVKGGIGETRGVVPAIVIIPLIGISIFCAGCFGSPGVGAGVVSQAAKQDAAGEQPKGPLKKAGRSDEERASNQLMLAKAVLSRDKARGTRHLQEIVEKYPDTECGKEAAELLSK